MAEKDPNINPTEEEIINDLKPVSGFNEPEEDKGEENLLVHMGKEMHGLMRMDSGRNPRKASKRERPSLYSANKEEPKQAFGQDGLSIVTAIGTTLGAKEAKLLLRFLGEIPSSGYKWEPNRTCSLTIPLNVLMDDYNYSPSSKSSARRRFLKEIANLSEIKDLQLDEGEYGDIGITPLLGGFSGIRKGNVVLTVSAEFMQVFQRPKSPWLSVPRALWKILDGENPNAFLLGLTLYERANQNMGKANENVLSLKSLLNQIPALQITHS